MAKITPYLLVKDGLRAIDLYKDVFGAKLISRMNLPPEVGKQMGFPDDYDYENSTMHAVLEIMGDQVFLSDVDQDITPEGSVEIMIDVESKQEIDKIWKKVKSNKFKINMDFEKTFWGAWFGRFIDSEGIGWQINFQEDPVP